MTNDKDKVYPDPPVHTLGEKADQSLCKIWKGAKTSSGYPVIWHKGRTRQLNRVVWEEKYGPIKRNMFVCHKCDNPLCYNIDHLFLGTATDNCRDMALKNRDKKARGEEHGNSVLDRKTVDRIRQLKKNGMNYNAIARVIGISRTGVRKAATGLTWGWYKPETIIPSRTYKKNKRRKRK